MAEPKGSEAETFTVARRNQSGIGIVFRERPTQRQSGGHHCTGTRSPESPLEQSGDSGLNNLVTVAGESGIPERGSLTSSVSKPPSQFTDHLQE